MTDRTNHLTVILDKEYRVDDAQAIIDAISMIKCVAKVDINVSDISNHLAKESAKIDLRKQIYDVLK